MILVFKYLIPKNYNGIAIYPFIFLKHKSLSENPILVNHEKIHLRQQIELLWIFFFIWYVVEFLFHLIRFGNWDRAYHMISFEKEAYQNEENLDYLKNRKIWSFSKYFIIKNIE